MRRRKERKARALADTVAAVRRLSSPRFHRDPRPPIPGASESSDSSRTLATTRAEQARIQEPGSVEEFLVQDNEVMMVRLQSC